VDGGVKRNGPERCGDSEQFSKRFEEQRALTVAGRRRKPVWKSSLEVYLLQWQQSLSDSDQGLGSGGPATLQLQQAFHVGEFGSAEQHAQRALTLLQWLVKFEIRVSQRQRV